MKGKEGVDERNQFIRLLDSITIGKRPFDVQCSVEYFNNHCQVYTSLSDVFRQYEFVLFILKGIVEENLHDMIHPMYLKDLTRYIKQCEIEKSWFILMENTYRFPIVDYYMKVLKFELLQYSFNDCMYLLKVRCLNFTELDVRNTIDVVQYFFSGCFDRTITICPQIKWKFGANPTMTVMWLIGLPKYLKDNFTGYRRKLLNECWNDFYDGPEWKSKQCKKNGIMDYMKKLTGYGGLKPSNPLNRFVFKKKSLFEVDDTIFAKFQDDKEVYIRRSIFSFSTILLLLFLVFFCRWVIQIYRK